VYYLYRVTENSRNSMHFLFHRNIFYIEQNILSLSDTEKSGNSRTVMLEGEVKTPS